MWAMAVGRGKGQQGRVNGPVGLTMQSGMKSRGNGQYNIQSFIDKNNRILEDCWVVICGQWQLGPGVMAKTVAIDSQNCRDR
jgi:hypothetical protein